MAADYAVGFRDRGGALHPSATAGELRDRFCVDLPQHPRDGLSVLKDLIEAAEPGLVGSTDPNFFAWVMGGSNTVGVAADWLTSVWGQNAAIYQTSPAAAIAEEAVATWLLELLDLPRDASVGFVTGATMASFVGLAAARTSVLARYGHDFEMDGLQGAPRIAVFLSDDIHVSNRIALRHIGLGDANCARIPSDAQGCMSPTALEKALAERVGPKIIITQAGHINSGAFEDFESISTLAKAHNAWLHVDGAFGMWARASTRHADQTKGVDLADSWSVDGHKWMQIPYDSGFAIVRDHKAHQRAMEIEAGYLNLTEGDGRNPTHFGPELSRRARGFAAWAVFQSLGRRGVAALVDAHCDCAQSLAQQVSHIDGLRVLNRVQLNQVVIGATSDHHESVVPRLADALNATNDVFVRPAVWKGRQVLRVSVINALTESGQVNALATKIERCWEALMEG